MWSSSWRSVVVSCAVAACGGDDALTGPITRYVIDRIEMPRTSQDARAIATDLDGDGSVDNQLGTIGVALATTSDLSADGDAMIDNGAIASSVELQADSLTDDAHAGVTVVGHLDAPAMPIIVSLTGGAATTREHGQAVLVLPLFTNADPLALRFEHLHVELAPDGQGGLDAVFRGALDVEHVRDVAYAGFVQMFETEPQRHIVLARAIDRNRDRTLAFDEIDQSVFGLLMRSDVEIDGRERMSAAFRAHLVRCETTRCRVAPPVPSCRDRVRDLDETDVDCGGSCQPCAPAKRCALPTDCQTGGCDGGTCRPPTCSDGLRTGWESDVDCGGECPPCAAGKACAQRVDCTSNVCDGSLGSLGVCQ